MVVICEYLDYGYDGTKVLSRFSMRYHTILHRDPEEKFGTKTHGAELWGKSILVGQDAGIALTRPRPCPVVAFALE